MDKAFFKIVIPNYNGMAYVRQCLDSIFGQTFQDFFVVFVDDRSTDLSYEFAKMYERKHPDKMKAIRLDEKKYVGGARNAGIDFPVECEYYYFLDSDDMLASSDSLNILRKNVQDSPDILLVSFNFLQPDGKYRSSVRSKINYMAFIDNIMAGGWNSASAKTVRHDKIQRFLEGCMRAEDSFQWLKLLDGNPRIKQIKDEIFTYRQHCQSVTHTPLFKEHKPMFVKAMLEFRDKAQNRHVVNSINARLKIKF